jgi:hypothetical protein
MPDATRDLALSAEERRALHALIEKLGERALVAELNVSRQALGRALAGLGVRRGTIALVRAGLATLNAWTMPDVGSDEPNADPSNGR